MKFLIHNPESQLLCSKLWWLQPDKPIFLDVSITPPEPGFDAGKLLCLLGRERANGWQGYRSVNRISFAPSNVTQNATGSATRNSTYSSPSSVLRAPRPAPIFGPPPNAGSQTSSQTALRSALYSSNTTPVVQRPKPKSYQSYQDSQSSWNGSPTSTATSLTIPPNTIHLDLSHEPDESQR